MVRVSDTEEQRSRYDHRHIVTGECVEVLDVHLLVAQPLSINQRAQTYGTYGGLPHVDMVHGMVHRNIEPEPSLQFDWVCAPF